MQGTDDIDIRATDADQGPQLVLAAFESARFQGGKRMACGMCDVATQRMMRGKVK